MSDASDALPYVPLEVYEGNSACSHSFLLLKADVVQELL